MELCETMLVAAAVVRLRGGDLDMKLKLSAALGAAGFALALGVGAAKADLIGTSVSGVLNFATFDTNFFDPATGFVPAGFGNSAPNGPNNVVISASVVAPEGPDTVRVLHELR